MAKCPFAIWDPITPWYTRVGTLRSHTKIIEHKTQGSNYPRSTYVAGGGVPHFTVTRDRIYQHFDTRVWSRALRNLAGGVQTNLAGAIQYEAVGFSGQTDLAVARNCRRLADWIERTHKIPHVWPGGRPPTHPGQLDHVSTHTWNTAKGHYAHSQVPENNHWDPAWTDQEWAVISSLLSPSPPPTPDPDNGVIVSTFGNASFTPIYADSEWLVLWHPLDSDTGQNFHFLDRAAGSTFAVRFGRQGDTFVDIQRVAHATFEYTIKRGGNEYHTGTRVV